MLLIGGARSPLDCMMLWVNFFSCLRVVHFYLWISYKMVLRQKEAEKKELLSCKEAFRPLLALMGVSFVYTGVCLIMLLVPMGLFAGKEVRVPEWAWQNFGEYS